MDERQHAGTCQQLVESLEQGLPAWLMGRSLELDRAWDGDRLHLALAWRDEPGTDVSGILNLQFLPDQRQVWIGHLEISSPWRGKGVGGRLVRQLENACRAAGVRVIRLFTRFDAMGFWLRMGYHRESGGRFLQKNIPEPSATAERTPI